MRIDSTRTQKFIIKEGPLVFLRDIVTFELLAGVVLLGISFLGNYEALFRSTGILDYIRYDLVVMITFSVLQIVFIFSIFLRWYFRQFEIRDTEIIRRTGVFLRKHVSVPMQQIATVEFSQGIIERAMKHGTIVLEHTNGRITRFRNVENWEDSLLCIKSHVQKIHGNRAEKMPIEKIITQEESSNLEFKESLRADTKNGGLHKDIERASLKTLVGFMNAQGGTLIIGVSDSGAIMGLERDYATLPRKNRDGFENHITTLVKNHIGLKFRSLIKINFESLEHRDVCRIEVEPAPRPVYFKGGEGKEEFFVRTGNSTQPFSMSEAEEYIKSKWQG